MTSPLIRQRITSRLTETSQPKGPLLKNTGKVGKYKYAIRESYGSSGSWVAIKFEVSPPISKEDAPAFLDYFGPLARAESVKIVSRASKCFLSATFKEKGFKFSISDSGTNYQPISI